MTHIEKVKYDVKEHNNETQLVVYNVDSAQRFAREGKIEEWVQQYITSGTWANPGLSDGLKMQKRWWNGPIEVDIKELSRVVGPEPEMEYQVKFDEWRNRIDPMAKSFADLLSIPPLIVEYRGGELSVRDGNTRLGVMELLGWSKCWVIIWYNAETDYHEHNSRLFGT